LSNVKREKLCPGVVSADRITPFYCHALVWVWAFSLYKHENEDTKPFAAAEALFEDVGFLV